jgi:hypothetical protein
MPNLAAICGTILVVILSGTVLVHLGFPANMSIGLTLFGTCVLGLLLMALRLSLQDRTRGGHHD